MKLIAIVALAALAMVADATAPHICFQCETLMNEVLYAHTERGLNTKADLKTILQSHCSTIQMLPDAPGFCGFLLTDEEINKAFEVVEQNPTNGRQACLTLGFCSIKTK